MNEVILPSRLRHRIRNSSPGCLRPSKLPLGHEGSPQYLIFTSEPERNILRGTNKHEKFTQCWVIENAGGLRWPSIHKRYRNPLSIWLILSSSRSRALATWERRDDICSAADSAFYQAPRCKHLITRKYAASFIVNWGWSICRRVSAPVIQDVLWRTIHLVTCHDRAKNGLASNYETQDLYMCEGTRGDTVARVLHGALTGVKSKWGVIASCWV